MSTNQNTFNAIVTQAALAVAPLKEVVSNSNKFQQLLYSMGWEINAQSVPSAYAALATDVDRVLTALLNLPASPSLDDILNLLNKIRQLYIAIESAVNINAAPSGNFNPADFKAEFAKRLAELLAISYIQDRLPLLYNILRFSGVITSVFYSENVSIPGRPSFVREEFNFDNLKSVIDNPVELIKGIYNWGLTDFDFEPIMNLIQGFFISKGVAASLEVDPGDTADSFGFYQDNLDSRLILKVPFYSFFASGQYYEIGFQLFKYVYNQQSGLLLQPLFPNTVSQTLPINDDTNLVFTGNSNTASLFGVDVNTNGINVIYPGAPSTTLPQAGFGVTLQYLPEKPVHVFGNPLGSRIELSGAEFAFTADHLNDSFEVELDALIKNLSIVLSGGDGDSFIAKLLGNTEKRIDFEFGVSWSNTGGLCFRGAGGFELVLNPHIELGPLAIENLKLALQAPPSSTLKTKLIAAAGLKLELGPFTAIVEEIGVELALTFASGNAGPFDIRAGFKPPTGLGLSIKSETVTGGGFLSFNKDEARYVGMLELSIKKKIAVKAIGILTTKLPGGQSGYSLLLLITAEFQPIQLGFGFTLNGVGGLVALHRTMNFDVLRDGVRNNSLDNILFPTDPVANINSILSTLENGFPVQENRYVLGPMAIIGWGTPTLITAEVGLFIEVPDPVRTAIIGVIRALLPDENKALLKLQISFIGTIDFEAKYITFDASLFDSHLQWMTLSGDMVFRLRWGDDPVFVLSVGGFHPSFSTAGLSVPAMNRITANLLGGDNPRLTLSAYFAVTSNTVQFGSAIDFYYKVTDKIRVVGYLGFDALFRFSPFYFISTIGANLSVYRKDNCLFATSLSGSLEGPAPWRIRGNATFTVLKIDFTVSFDTTFGDNQNTTLPDEPVMVKLNAALAEKTNWNALLPAGKPLLVTVRELPDQPGVVVVHPQSTMGVSQKVVPLDITINKFGSSRPSDFTTFSIAISGSFTTSKLQEFFAPGEFIQFTESERLSHKSFEKYNSGLQIQGGDALTSSTFRELQLEYDTIYMDSRHNPNKYINNTQIQADAFRAFIGNNAAAKSNLGSQQKPGSYLAPAKLKVQQESYAVAKTEDLAVYNSLTATSQAEAQMLLKNLLLQQPELESKIQVVSSFELA